MYLTQSEYFMYIHKTCECGDFIEMCNVLLFSYYLFLRHYVPRKQLNLHFQEKKT